MFTGIIETMGTITQITKEKENIHFEIASDISHEFKVDQSVSHDGVCLTVTHLGNGKHTVTAIHETLQKTNLGGWEEGSVVNIERCMPANGRFDGHIVQGHVDQVGECKRVLDEDGSWRYTIAYDSSKGNITVEKGSICINGTSLTVVGSKEGEFSVAIIPYTYEHTNFHALKEGDKVNLEFDILGKYVQAMLSKRENA